MPAGSAADDRRRARFERSRAAHLADTGLEPVDEHHGVDRGLCAGCRRPDHIAYGPDCPGPLCPDCERLLAAWRALTDDARRRTPLVYPRWKGR